jgi:hypothetical protein
MRGKRIGDIFLENGEFVGLRRGEVEGESE